MTENTRLRELTEDEQKLIDAGYTRKYAMSFIYHKNYNKQYYAKNREKLKQRTKDKYADEEFRKKHAISQKNCIVDPYKIQRNKAYRMKSKDTRPYDLSKYTIYCELCDLTFGYLSDAHDLSKKHIVNFNIYKKKMKAKQNNLPTLQTVIK
jgi:hypothetical protein